MPQQKRKASTIASAKIAEDAGSGRKRKSDAKEEHHPSTKETDKSKGGVETEQSVSDDKNEASDNKRRKKQLAAQDIHEDNGTNGNEPPSEHDQMLIDDINKDVESHKTTDKHNGKSEQAADEEVNKVQNELKK